MAAHDTPPDAKTVIGGRYGSPTVTVALPFSKVTATDPELRDAVAELAGLVARLAESGPPEIRAAAEELVTRLSARA